MMKKFEFIKYVFIFIFSFCAMSFLFTYFDGDVIWSYGFSYAISNGEVPYLDFNMIITPFYPIFNAFFMKVLSNNILTFYIVNSLLITGLFYLLFKIFNNKAWFFLIFLYFPIPAVVLPTYNLFLIFLVILLMYLEKENADDYLIGFILGIGILTKQTVGVFLCFASFYYLFKDYKKIIKRVCGCFIPCFVFLIYLLVFDCLDYFFDLCLFGMFDFANDNGKLFNALFFICIFMIGSIVYRIIKNKNDINNYYVLMFSVILLPLFDLNHFCYFLFVYVCLFLNNVRFNEKQLFICSWIFTLFYSFTFLFFTMGFEFTYPNHYDNFQYRLMYNRSGEFIIRDKLNNYINENSDKNIIILSSEAYFYKITNNLDITYFDLINYGNHGYNGTEKMIDKIRNTDENTIFIVGYDEYIKGGKYNRQQVNKKLMKYVMDNGELIDEINCYRIYRLNT